MTKERQEVFPPCRWQTFGNWVLLLGRWGHGCVVGFSFLHLKTKLLAWTCLNEMALLLFTVWPAEANRCGVSIGMQDAIISIILPLCSIMPIIPFPPFRSLAIFGEGRETIPPKIQNTWVGLAHACQRKIYKQRFPHTTMQ